MSAASCAPRRSRTRGPSTPSARSPTQLAEVENREIDKIIRKQEEVGLKVATDGEFRRSWW
jgi:methionine synthase II (cobalamin-independent)